MSRIIPLLVALLQNYDALAAAFSATFWLGKLIAFGVLFVAFAYALHVLLFSRHATYADEAVRLA